jgi:hypothetical protein
MFPYTLSSHHEKAKRNTIRVTNVKLSYCTNLALTYLMKNEMPIVHHVIERWGCDCIIEDGKGLNERT